ncbi:hypothetical protein [Desulforhopalus singaporensis]|uniref:Uncharacterized protein n=1 Tax=Desulforhopalus singaporensis TaxID=91360 RepID=A0A1H0KQY3_9BACT|nr:hypothetical protein [Desulforhopalus singaporensis]SDO58377.1 hypothetical protein SAMN05660330_00596 [Desulforhopalus singaporensis]
MLITITNDKEIDTDRDLSPEERHVVQKLIGWKGLVDSMEQFRQKTRAALQTGWNNQGPVRLSPTLALIVAQLEQELSTRLAEKNRR